MLKCPRCRRANPDMASFCHHDGIPLRLTVPETPAAPTFDWTSPEGRRCTTMDELIRACLAEWDAVKLLLRGGELRSRFERCGRGDLATVALTAVDEPDDDAALQLFLEGLPERTMPVRPLIDPLPRRLQAEDIRRDEVRLLALKFLNRGAGYLHGTISVIEGERWLWLGEGISPVHTMWIGTRTEQAVTVQIDPTLLPTVGSYLGKIKVETNGGVLEIPVQANLVNRAESFQGLPAKTEKELAMLLRSRPKDAVVWIQDGSVRAWYAANGLPYPVKDPAAPQLAGVQQFFECAGFARPPILTPSDCEITAICLFPEVITRDVRLATSERKWVYVFAESDSMWLKPHEKVFVGPQAAEVQFDIDSSLMEAGRTHEGLLRLRANGGETVVISIRVDVRKGSSRRTRY